ncbi:MAG: hypothetical protein SFX19_04665 [Alphaproteobacteria bacterium]|nr:hypothetical protein [Alphaproteobacteria bacterium]
MAGDNGMVIDLIFWANVLACVALVVYAFFMFLQARGYYVPSPRIKKIIRWFCLFMLLMPVAARYQYSQSTILYLSAAMLMIGLLLKLKQKMGL